MPDHSNLIFVYGRYTLDEMIFKALYSQDANFYEAMEPLAIVEKKSGDKTARSDEESLLGC